MCFVHKHMQNADFGQILSRRASTKSRVTSRPMVRFLQTWYQKMRKTWKKKVMKKRVAISGGRDTVADFVQGGGGANWPPPPVKIGLTQQSMGRNEYGISGHLHIFVFFDEALNGAFEVLHFYTLSKTLITCRDM